MNDIEFLGTTIGFDLDYSSGYGENLALKGRTRGCSCCSNDVEVLDLDSMIEYLRRHHEVFDNHARWCLDSIKLLEEHGIPEITRVLGLVSDALWNFTRAESIATSLADGRGEDYMSMYYYPFRDRFGGYREAVQGLADEGLGYYAEMGTVEKLIASHFAPEKMRKMAEIITNLCSRYDVSKFILSSIRRHNEQS